MTEQHTSPFDAIKRVDEQGNEFWSARELYKLLGYSRWEKFQKSLTEAQTACRQSGYTVSDHFHLEVQIVKAGVTTRSREDCRLSRYACYLVIQNADPAKPIVALGQTYFAVQTRRQELAEQLADNIFRAAQTDAKIRREQIHGKSVANRAHYTVGREVRETIQRLGGTLPEDLPTPEKSIQQVQRQEQKRLEQGPQLPLFGETGTDE